jgi:hypothetical protein
MRVVIATFIGAMATTVILASPALARPSNAPNAGDELSKPPCYGYEQNLDGSWRQIPCQENGLSTQAGAKVSTRDAGKASR